MVKLNVDEIIMSQNIIKWFAAVTVMIIHALSKRTYHTKSTCGLNSTKTGPSPYHMQRFKAWDLDCNMQTYNSPLRAWEAYSVEDSDFL